MNPNEVAAARIRKLRTERNMNQHELAVKFSEFCNKNVTMAANTISTWENGRKLPPTDSIVNLALFFGVTVDYILGLSDDPGNSNESSRIISFEPRKIEIQYKDLAKYNKQPVYVQFPSMKYENQWGLLDYNNKLVVFLTFKMQLTPKATYFVAAPIETSTIKDTTRYLLNYKDVVKRENVYIESLSPDPAMAAKITGWYHKSPDNSFLINDSGLALSYEGLGVNYNAVEFLTSKNTPKKTK